MHYLRNYAQIWNGSLLWSKLYKFIMNKTAQFLILENSLYLHVIKLSLNIFEDIE